MRVLKLCLLSLCAFSLLVPMLASAGSNIRMYKINKKQQQRRIVFGNAASEPGCHNLIVSRKIHRVAQSGFAWCSLFAEDDCAADAILPAMWTGKKYRKHDVDSTKPQEKLYPGSHWDMVSPTASVQSWYCEAEPAS